MAERLQSEVLQEYVDSRGVEVKVDAAGGVLRGVKLIGLESQNGRRYRESALASAAALYEEAKVNVNHPKGGPLAPRDYQDRLGVVRGVELRTGDGLYGDLHFNPKHALAEQLVWDAEHNPRNVGFSHNVLARLSRDGEAAVVEEITRVQSVDLVADPAATRGLFEQQTESPSPNPSPVPARREGGGLAALDEALPRWDALTLETLRLHRPDLVEEIETIETAALRGQLTEASDKSSQLERRQRVVELLAKHRLPLSSGDAADRHDGVSPALLEALVDIDENKLEQFVADLANLFSSDAQRSNANDWRPRSRDQTALLAMHTGEPLDGRGFARALKTLRN